MVTRPAQLTDTDEKELCSLAQRKYEDIATDLFRDMEGDKWISYQDLADVVLDQMVGERHRVHDDEQLLVARDAELSGLPWDRKLRTGTIATDVLVMLTSPQKAGRWAEQTVREYFKRQADKRGRIHG